MTVLDTLNFVAFNPLQNNNLISDATATFNKLGQNSEIYDAELIHNTSLTILDNEFAKVITSRKLFDIY